MIKQILSAFFLLGSVFAFGQSRHFIYIESAQPFFVKTAGKTAGSGSSGYVILSDLADSTARLRIGFPENRFPDQLFLVPVNGNDHGYLLQQDASGVWGLGDLQTTGSINALGGGGTFRSEPKKVSAFTMTLSRATDDPSLLFTTVRINPSAEQTQPLAAVVPETETIKEPSETPRVVTELVQDEVIKPADSIKIKPVDGAAPAAVIMQDSSAATPVLKTAVDITVPAAVIVQDSSAAAPVLKRAVDPPVTQATDVAYKPSVVKKRSESSTTAGFGLFFTDEYDGFRDTIRILIPNITGTAIWQPGAVAEPAAAKTPVNCRSVASDAAVAKTSRKIKVASDEEAMLELVRRLIRSDCISTAQALDLSRMFPGDGGKFKLFDLVYTHVSDPAAFATLQTELKDEYFIRQFRAILR